MIEEHLSNPPSEPVQQDLCPPLAGGDKGEEGGVKAELVGQPQKGDLLR
jgi:hypothetical protein